MPWCPVCKSEYREGITNCYDCKVPLVDSLDDIENESDSRDMTYEDMNMQMHDGAEMGTYPNPENMEDPQYAEYTENPEYADFENEFDEENASSGATFVKKSDQYQEYLFSAYTCALVGFAGMVFGFLNIAGVFNFVSVPFTQYILFGIFLAFFIGGLAMYKKAKSIQTQIKSENEQMDSINAWLSENIDTRALSSMKDPEVSDEINYFNYCEKIKDRLLSTMPETDPAMADSLIDEYVNGLLK